MGATFAAAPEVERVARELIPRHHRHLTHTRIEYLFRDGKWESHGKGVLGKCIKLTGHAAFLATRDESQPELFAIIINREAWEQMDWEPRQALVDHELCHAGIKIDASTGLAKLDYVAHDLEEFRCIVQRHGLWDDSLRLFAKDAQLAFEELRTEDTPITIESGGKSVTTNPAGLLAVNARLAER